MALQGHKSLSQVCTWKAATCASHNILVVRRGSCGFIYQLCCDIRRHGRAIACTQVACTVEGIMEHAREPACEAVTYPLPGPEARE